MENTKIDQPIYKNRAGSRNHATFKVELFVATVTGQSLLSIVKKNFILDIVGVLDPPSYFVYKILLAEKV